MLIAACSGGEPLGPDDPGGPAGCSTAAITALAVGQSVVLDARENGGCVRLPAAPAAGAEYLYVALSGSGEEVDGGVTADFVLAGNNEGGIAAAAFRAARAAVQAPAPTRAARFHQTLRERERALAELGGGPSLDRARVAVAPPQVGDARTFDVCANLDCDEFVDVDATARFVGQKVAIFLDDSVPDGGYSDTDLAQVGQLFDDFLYPIDTVAFGRESDIDGNGVVAVLLTDALNDLSGNCADGSVIVGYFFGLDLRPTSPNSNGGEVFYSLVPAPDDPGCGLSAERVNELLPTAFIHEFQHMISFNQHVLVRGGPAEETWLNEGLSHFAEELGGRQIPEDRCIEGDCLTQFVLSDADNAYNYLLDPEVHFLVEPEESGGTLEERGANWLFVRWLADHFNSRSDSLGTNVTRALVTTNRIGDENVAAVTGVPFATLAAEWQLANYLDNLPNFTAGNTRLQYLSWDFRDVFASFNLADPENFPAPYPLRPDIAVNGVYQDAGTLRGGSGTHVLIQQEALGDPVEFVLSDELGQVLPASVVPRIGLIRIR